MAKQIVCVNKFGIDLSGSLKKLNSRIVLLVQAKAVADDAPRLGRQLVVLGEFLSERRERDLALQVPQRSTVAFETLQVIRILTTQLQVDLFRLLVVVQLEVSTRHTRQDKARVELRLWQYFEKVQRFFTLELLQVVEGVAQVFEQLHKTVQAAAVLD